MQWINNYSVNMEYLCEAGNVQIYFNLLYGFIIVMRLNLFYFDGA